AAGLPPGLSMDPNHGLITGTIDPSAGGSYPVTVLARDTAGNSGSQSFAWNVAYLPQTPVLTPPGDQFDQAGDVVSLDVSGYDVTGDGLQYSATGLPAGLAIDLATGRISGTISLAAGSTTPYRVTVTATELGPFTSSGPLSTSE